MTKTRDFSEVIRNELASDLKLRAEVEKQLLDFSIARLIFNERDNAGLTQRELARRVGTHQSVIARLEDAEYGGHSLSMLRRIADALGSELKIDFVPKNQPSKEQSPTILVTSSSLKDGTVEICYGDFENKVKVEKSSASTALTAVA